MLRKLDGVREREIECFLLSMVLMDCHTKDLYFFMFVLVLIVYLCLNDLPQLYDVGLFSRNI